MSGGWVKEHRSVWSHPLFEGHEFSPREAWLWLIKEAAIEPKTVRVAGRMVELQRGELTHSIRFLAEKWQWSKSRVDRFLAVLRDEGMIKIRDSSGTARGTAQSVITVCNYEEYQSREAVSGTAHDAEAGQQRDSSGTKNKNLRTQEGRIEDTPLPPKGGERAPASPKARKGPQRYSPDFERFYATYPDRPHQSPGEAWKVWQTLSPAERQAAQMGAEDYAAEVRRERTEPRYVKHCHRWLKGEGYRRFVKFTDEDFADARADQPAERRGVDPAEQRHAPAPAPERPGDVGDLFREGGGVCEGEGPGGDPRREAAGGCRSDPGVAVVAEGDRRRSEPAVCAARGGAHAARRAALVGGHAGEDAGRVHSRWVH